VSGRESLTRRTSRLALGGFNRKIEEKKRHAISWEKKSTGQGKDRVEGYHDGTHIFIQRPKVPKERCQKKAYGEKRMKNAKSKKKLC